MDLVLPEGAVVLQYADDLLISAETADICKEATWSLLNRLAQQGFKVSLSKLQFCETEAAELVALTRACILSAEKDVTIYTDSRYASGVAHDFGRIWQTRGFVSAEVEQGNGAASSAEQGNGVASSAEQRNGVASSVEQGNGAAPSVEQGNGMVSSEEQGNGATSSAEQ
ncbi:hypothetical protein QTP70_012726 [Hemibagrus guttatus]|uniref:ribonuclease H n=1 Tax=Hemibagrus guttatus TaxID=175788 RepID=A0AAE0VBA6_9TELE|nr:hypothetical protein QTP70_012726 [Hemibagrus guttatus]